MNQPFDVLRSLLRSAADRGRERLGTTRAVRGVRQLFERLTKQRWRVTEDTLTTAAAHAEGVEAAMVACRPGRIFVDASLAGGEDVHFSLAPTAVRFAPRGAKEISFEVEPPGSSNSSIVGALAGCIAQATWPMIFPVGGAEVGGAIVERESPASVRVDLRTVPAVRRFAAKGTAAMIFDVLELESIRVEPGALSLKLKLPPIGP